MNVLKEDFGNKLIIPDEMKDKCLLSLQSIKIGLDVDLLPVDSTGKKVFLFSTAMIVAQNDDYIIVFATPFSDIKRIKYSEIKSEELKKACDLAINVAFRGYHDAVNGTGGFSSEASKYTIVDHSNKPQSLEHRLTSYLISLSLLCDEVYRLMEGIELRSEEDDRKTNYTFSNKMFVDLSVTFKYDVANFKN